MPNLVHIYFGLVTGMVLCGAGLLFWVNKCLREPGFDPFSRVGGEEKENKAGDMGQPAGEMDYFRRELDQASWDLQSLEEEKEEVDFAAEISQHQKIYQAFDAGQSVAEIARNFAKNQGEVELILHLRNHAGART